MDEQRETLISRALNRWGAIPWSDVLVGVVIALGYLAYRSLADDVPVILDASARATVYVALVATAGVLLAFGVTPFAIVLVLTPGPRLRALLQTHADELRQTLMAMLWAYLALLVVSLAALGIDTGANSTRWIRYVVLAIAVQALLATARLVRSFGLLLLNIGRDQATDQEPLARIDRRVS